MNGTYPADEDSTAAIRIPETTRDFAAIERTHLDNLRDLERRISRMKATRERLWRQWLKDRFAGTSLQPEIERIRSEERSFPRTELDRRHLEGIFGFMPRYPSEFDGVEETISHLETTYEDCIDRYRALIDAGVSKQIDTDVTVTRSRNPFPPETATIRVTYAEDGLIYDFAVFHGDAEVTGQVHATLFRDGCALDRETLDILARLERETLARADETLLEAVRQHVCRNPAARDAFDLGLSGSLTADFIRVSDELTAFLDRIEYSYFHWRTGLFEALEIVESKRKVPYSDRNARDGSSRHLDLRSSREDHYTKGQKKSQ